MNHQRESAHRKRGALCTELLGQLLRHLSVNPGNVHSALLNRRTAFQYSTAASPAFRALPSVFPETCRVFGFQCGADGVLKRPDEDIHCLKWW